MSDDARTLRPRQRHLARIGHPAALVGGLRALQIQALHPLAMAGVAQHSDYLEDPLSRLQRTAGYVSTVTFGTREEAEAAAAIVRRVHRTCTAPTR